MNWAQVLSGERMWSAEQGDSLQLMKAMPDQSVDLVFGSPPYENARVYSCDFKLKGQAWVDWMVQFYVESLRICRGLVAFVIEGRTEKFSYSGTPLLLAADLIRRGIVLRKPPVFHRVGISGSGGPDWLRNDYEFILCATNGGKLPHSNNTVMGKPPKYGPGGEFSHRNSKGKRVNQWGANGTTGGGRGKKADRTKTPRPSHEFTTERASAGRLRKLVLANPGNVLHYKVGGGVMGDRRCHLSQAPFPIGLAEFMVRSFSHEHDVVLDPFVGSGTTLEAAARWYRRGIGFDIDPEMIEVACERTNDHACMYHRNEWEKFINGTGEDGDTADPAVSDAGAGGEDPLRLPEHGQEAGGQRRGQMRDPRRQPSGVDQQVLVPAVRSPGLFEE